MQAEFEALLRGVRSQVGALVALLEAGSLDGAGFAEAMAERLHDAHTRAVMLGRHHAGDTAPLEEDDRGFADLVMDDEAEHLDRFAADLDGGSGPSADRYRDEHGHLRTAAVARRAEMYADQILATANEAWSLALPEETLFTWHAEGGESSCEECPARAAGGPYTADTLPEWGTAECFTNCRCHITTEAGASGFTMPD